MDLSFGDRVKMKIAFPMSVPQTELDLIVGKMIKPSAIKNFLIIADGKFTDRLIEALKANNYFDESTKVLAGPNGI